MTDAELQALCERLVLLPVATAEDMHDLRLLVDEARRGRELETACDAILYHVDSDAGRERHWYIRERQSQGRLDAIGRLLEEPHE